MKILLRTKMNEEEVSNIFEMQF